MAEACPCEGKFGNQPKRYRASKTLLDLGLTPARHKALFCPTQASGQIAAAQLGLEDHIKSFGSSEVTGEG